MSHLPVTNGLCMQTRAGIWAKACMWNMGLRTFTRQLDSQRREATRARTVIGGDPRYASVSSGVDIFTVSTHATLVPPKRLFQME